MIELQIQSIDSPVELALAHPDRWDGNRVDNPNEDLPSFQARSPRGLERIPAHLLSRQLEAMHPRDISTLATFGDPEQTYNFDAADHAATPLLSIEYEMLVLNEGPLSFSGISAARRTLKPLTVGKGVAYTGSQLDYIRVHTLGKIIRTRGRGFDIVRPMLVGSKKNVTMALILTGGRISIGEVQGEENLLTRVNQVHIVRHSPPKGTKKA